MVDNKRDAILRLYRRRLTRPAIANLLGLRIQDVETVVDGDDSKTSGKEFTVRTEEDFAVWAIVGPETDAEERQLSVLRDRMLARIRRGWSPTEREHRARGGPYAKSGPVELSETKDWRDPKRCSTL